MLTYNRKIITKRMMHAVEQINAIPNVSVFDFEDSSYFDVVVTPGPGIACPYRINIDKGVYSNELCMSRPIVQDIIEVTKKALKQMV